MRQNTASGVGAALRQDLFRFGICYLPTQRPDLGWEERV